jgi:endonuclease/exonuclease/phosphatase family metal-dependent hydrolase
MLEECRTLRRAVEPYPTIEALRAAPEWPALDARFQRLLGTPRLLPAAAPPAPSSDPSRVRAAHWNIEHGNEYEQVERALLTHPRLRDADLVLLNEVDLGMARAANRDVTADLARALGLHSVFGALFLELTPGRDDDLRFAARRENQESLFGVAILSRWPITETRIVDLPSPERIQFDVERMVGRHIGLVATIERPGAPFVAVSAHLEVHRTRAHRAAQVRVLADALGDETRPVILAGDFNSHTFDRGLWHAPLAGALALLLAPDGALRRRLLHPDQGPAREPLFDELRDAGFEWTPFVDREPSLQLRFDRLDELHALFGPAHGLARRLFARAEQRARLRLDWFAGRGWQGGRGSTVPDLDGPGRASDHAPLVAEFKTSLPHPAAPG